MDLVALGAMQPSFGPEYECLSNWSPDETKPTGTVSFSKDQWTSGPCRTLLGQRDLHTLFPVITLATLLVDFSVTLSVTHETDVVTPSDPIFFQIFPPKILRELILLRFLVSGCQLPLQTMGAVLIRR